MSYKFKPHCILELPPCTLKFTPAKSKIPNKDSKFYLILKKYYSVSEFIWQLAHVTSLNQIRTL